MIELSNGELVFRFPQVHDDAVCRIDFQRTLRIPDDNREYPLPPGLGRFPVEHVEDHAGHLPSEWAAHGGVLFPMYQAEALWINFSCRTRSGASYPFAIKVAAGKINAVTGDTWHNSLGQSPQDYIVVPEQPWLDGFCIRKGIIRQFVAMPLGSGYTAEEQRSGAAEHGGLQIIVYPMKRDHYEQLQRPRVQMVPCECRSVEPQMGLAPGGLMRQHIYEDPYGFDAWDTTVSSRCFVHLLNSVQWREATGKAVPTAPPSASEYTMAGLPWFEYYNESVDALDGCGTLADLDSVAVKGCKLGQTPLPNNDPLKVPNVMPLDPGASKVNDGQW